MCCMAHDLIFFGIFRNACLRMFLSMCECVVCVCMREREGERERTTTTQPPQFNVRRRSPPGDLIN